MERPGCFGQIITRSGLQNGFNNIFRNWMDQQFFSQSEHCLNDHRSVVIFGIMSSWLLHYQPAHCYLPGSGPIYKTQEVYSPAWGRCWLSSWLCTGLISEQTSPNAPTQSADVGEASGESGLGKGRRGWGKGNHHPSRISVCPLYSQNSSWLEEGKYYE